MPPHVSELLARIDPVSLEQVDELASLQRRVDQKYLLEMEDLARLLGELAEDHRALEIDGDRCFHYESCYFDTPELTTYRDHVEGRRPRAKIRSRLYVETRTCVFEAKLKGEEGETAKDSIDIPISDHGRVTPKARRFLEGALAPLGGRLDVAGLESALTTRFERFTLVAVDGSERVTCDLSLQLVARGGGAVGLRPGHALLETKSEGGGRRCDSLLEELGVEPMSFSKYRVGIGLLVADGDEQADAMAEHFLPLSEPAAGAPTR